MMDELEKHLHDEGHDAEQLSSLVQTEPQADGMRRAQVCSEGKVCTYESKMGSESVMKAAGSDSNPAGAERDGLDSKTSIVFKVLFRGRFRERSGKVLNMFSLQFVSANGHNPSLFDVPHPVSWKGQKRS